MNSSRGPKLETLKRDGDMAGSTIVQSSDEQVGSDGAKVADIAWRILATNKYDPTLASVYDNLFVDAADTAEGPWETVATLNRSTTSAGGEHHVILYSPPLSPLGPRLRRLLRWRWEPVGTVGDYKASDVVFIWSVTLGY